MFFMTKNAADTHAKFTTLARHMKLTIRDWLGVLEPFKSRDSVLHEYRLARAE